VAYQSLYRRYRSQRFSELRGQNHVTTALKAAVANGRYGHAYLFSGPRGTGKTSTARILAKALNCPNLVDGEPCCECESCLAIEQGRSFDLHELDAASHNKVDDIRDLISRVNLGSPGRTKVYILDEVHMLSAGAENALLKTLEEPPDHVVFVLATTEPHKVVETIRSRTQHFNFHLLPAEELEEHVRYVISDAGLDVPEEAIEYVLRQGGGSARDTLSALDLVAAAGGVPAGSDIGVELATAIGAGDPGAAIATIQAGLTQGMEARVIGETTVSVLRNAFLASMGSTSGQLNDSAQATAGELATALGPATITRSLEAIGQALVDMRQAPDPRVPLEVTVLGLCRSATGAGAPSPVAESGPPAGTEPGTDLIARLEARVDALEQELAALTAGGPAIAAPPATVTKESTPSTASGPAASNRSPSRSATTSPEPETDPAEQSAAANGPAAAARRRLKETTAKRPPSPRRRAKSPMTAPASEPGPEPEPASAATPEPSEQAMPGAEPEPDRQATPPTPATDQPLTEAEAKRAVEVQLNQVSQKVRVRFNVGTVTGVDGSSILFSIPNVHYRDRCEEVKGELEEALSNHFGRTIAVSVKVDDSPSSVSLDPAKMEPAPVADDESYGDIGPIEDLADAGDHSSNSVDRLTKAFPGSTVIEHDEP
jgi:DNA polymerase-3 subunit gamma/tau